MTLEKRQLLDQVEIKFVNGLPAHVFLQISQEVVEDGVVLTRNIHRLTDQIDSALAREVLGDDGVNFVIQNGTFVPDIPQADVAMPTHPTWTDTPISTPAQVMAKIQEMQAKMAPVEQIKKED